MVDSFSALIDRFGIGPFSEAIGISYGAAKKMRWRNSVAPEYWPKIITACQAKGWNDVSADLLMEFAAGRADRPDPTALPQTEAAA